jgi:peptide/nickel transport system permease protein
VAAFLGRRVLLAAGVLLAVSFGSFVLIATKFSTQCPSQFSPTGGFPPLAANVGQASSLYWDWLRTVPSGRAVGAVCGSSIAEPLWTGIGHTAALLALTALFVIVLSLALGTLAAARAGSVLDALFRAFSYTVWAVPSFLLALMLGSVVTWARERFGFHAFAKDGWPGYCPITYNLYSQTGCPPAGSGVHYVVAVLQHITVPALALALAFVGVHSRYLRSSLLVSLHAPFTTTAYAKGLSERRVVLHHALRNSLATFTSVLLLDFGALFGAAMAVDWVFHLNGLGTLFISEIGGVGSGDGPRYLDAYAVESLLTVAAALVVTSGVLAECAVAWLDPRARVQ